MIFNDKIKRIVIKRYKSIKYCDLDLNDINILVGCDVSGKSNFISAFILLHNVLIGNLQNFINNQCGIDHILNSGEKNTSQVEFSFYLSEHVYSFKLKATDDNRLILEEEKLQEYISGQKILFFCSGHFESKLFGNYNKLEYNGYCDSNDKFLFKKNLELDYSNFSQYLYFLKNKYNKKYREIVSTIQIVAPFFNDFVFDLIDDVEEKMMEIKWTSKRSDFKFKIDHMTDDLFKFILIIIKILKPDELIEPLIVIDNIDHSLNPSSLHVLYSMIKSICNQSQVIISTQSDTLLSEFNVSDIIVFDVNKLDHVSKNDDSCNYETKISRIDFESISEYLNDYDLSEICSKNLIFGRL